MNIGVSNGVHAYAYKSVTPTLFVFDLDRCAAYALFTMAEHAKAAMERARIKRSVVALLAPLSLDEQGTILADLLLALDEETDEGEKTPTPPLPEEIEELFKNPQPGNGTGRKAAVIAALMAAPRMPIADLAAKVYGNANNNSKSKVRAMLWGLKKQGRIKRTGPAKWEVVPQKT